MIETMPPKPTVKPIHLLLETDLLEDIEDYQFNNRFHTRIETIKALLRMSLPKRRQRASKAGKNSSISSPPRTADS